MKKIFVSIFLVMLLITAALQTVGTISKNNNPNDPDFNKQWYLDNTGQTGGTMDADIDAPEAWDIETGKPDIIIAIIDSGVDYTHPDLADNMWINEDEIPDNSIDDDENGYVDDVRGWDWYNDDNDPLDDLGHGTYCTGIFGAVGNNNIGITGVCWNCKIMPLKYMGSTMIPDFNIDYLASAIEYAANNGANIMDISIVNYEHSTTLKDAVDYAYDKGVVLIHPAGNDDTSNKAYPGAYENVIAVGGTDHNDNRMNYYDDHYHAWIRSNYGPWLDVAAPGQLVYSTTPTYHVTLNDYGFEQNYDYGTGTSASGPIVAGVAGLLLSRDFTLSPEEIKTLICENVDPYDSEYDLGSGRINAYKALSASNQQPSPPTIDGPISGKTGELYDYDFTNCVDPDGDDMTYHVEWDDGGTDEGFVASGGAFTLSHSWNKENTYTIRAKLIDEYDAESEWATYDVTITKKSKAINTLFLNWLQNHLNMFPILSLLLQQLGIQN